MKVPIIDDEQRLLDALTAPDRSGFEVLREIRRVSDLRRAGPPPPVSTAAASDRRSACAPRMCWRLVGIRMHRTLVCLVRALAAIAASLVLASCTPAARPTAPPAESAPTPAPAPSPSAVAQPSPSPAAPASPSPSPAPPVAAPSPATGAPTLTIRITDNLRFDPAEQQVSVGSTVVWLNTGSVQHTVTDDPDKAQDKSHAALPPGAQPWDSGPIDSGKSFQHTFTVPGTYRYFCIPHEAAGMLGTIVVTG